MIEIQFWWLAILPVFFAIGWLAARVDIKHVIAESHSLPAAYFKAVNHLLAGEMNKAVDIYVDIAKNHSETIELQATLGQLFRRRGELERAIRMHQKILARRGLSDTQRQQTQLDLAIDFIKAGLFDRAEKILHDLSNTESARLARKELLAIYQQEHEWQKAIATAELLRDESHSFQHEIAQFYCELAAESLIRNQNDKAISELNLALKEHRQSARARLMLGEIAFSQGETDLAIEHWLKIPAQDVHYLALAARLILNAYSAKNQLPDGIQQAIDWDNEAGVATIAALLDVTFSDDKIILAGQDVSQAIRAEAIGSGASQVAALPLVRDALLQRQRAFATEQGLVADGRDMASVVFPAAQLKVFLSASAQVRAERRFKQLIARGEAADLALITADLLARDERDRLRSVAPLAQASDALLLETSNLTADEAVAQVLAWWRSKH